MIMFHCSTKIGRELWQSGEKGIRNCQIFLLTRFPRFANVDVADNSYKKNQANQKLQQIVWNYVSIEG